MKKVTGQQEEIEKIDGDKKIQCV